MANGMQPAAARTCIEADFPRDLGALLNAQLMPLAQPRRTSVPAGCVRDDINPRRRSRADVGRFRTGGTRGGGGGDVGGGLISMS